MSYSQHNNSRRYLNATESALYSDYEDGGDPADAYDDDRDDGVATQPYADDMETSNMVVEILSALQPTLDKLNEALDKVNTRLDTTNVILGNLADKVRYIHARVPQHNKVDGDVKE